MFRNAKVFRLDGTFAFDQLQLHDRLGERAFRPCGPLETATLGWASPLGPNAESLAHQAGGCLLIAARRQERLLPASVVAEAVAEKVAEIEQSESRDVGRRERTRLREELLTEMLPRAFTRSRLLRAYIDPAANWLVVDASSDKLAEELVSLLRETLGSLPAKPLRATTAVDERLSTWVAADDAPSGFDIEDQCELRDQGDSRGVVRCRGQDLTSPEIKAHLDSGKRVVALALTWNERLSFVLGEDLALKRLRFSDELIEEALDDNAEDDQARLDAEFIIMAGELRSLLEALSGEFAPAEAG
ncbi:MULTISPECIES: recombination-associated protein RdgC [Thiorhodovibrio]|uniref:recombination-associated protein RdgC n=1 Tax=Thiorhodovibrio TaxID=61593 RepID=UPI001913E333|nr:recombination-associated protein RdgC [Thiorhodovibrio litoralis]MBK5970924.1 recombination-associated protein RdgC [Thiorhodovibrio winogradskyi]WPL10711.1 Recombination-associated protein RdgC [Thiorhodovibrio litoralis]